MAVPTKWKIVVFSNGKRTEKRVNGDPKKFQEVVKGLNDRPGVKAHLISRVKAYPPPKEEGAVGQPWCPYCRRWRWFAEMDIPVHGQGGIKVRMLVCKWCWISVEDFYVRRYNPDWAESQYRRRRSRSKRRKKVNAEV